MDNFIFASSLLILAAGLLAGPAWFLFRKRRGFLRWKRMGSGFLAVVLGILLLTGTMGGPGFAPSSAAAEEAEAVGNVSEDAVEDVSDHTTKGKAGKNAIPAPDFTLVDQYGVTHTLSGYQGKVVFLNLWTTWGPWCVYEMPDIEEIYHELGENQEDVIILGLDAPSSHDTADEAGIIAFLEEHEWTYPVLIDPTGDVMSTYLADGYPTTWLIRADGTLMGYYSGAMDKDQMLRMIQRALEE